MATYNFCNTDELNKIYRVTQVIMQEFQSIFQKALRLGIAGPDHEAGK